MSEPDHPEQMQLEQRQPRAPGVDFSEQAPARAPSLDVAAPLQSGSQAGTRAANVAQFTFVEALAQLQAAHRRELEHVHKELRKTNRKMSKMAQPLTEERRDRTGSGENWQPQQVNGGAQGSVAEAPIALKSLQEAVDGSTQGAVANAPIVLESLKEAGVPGSVPTPAGRDVHADGGAVRAILKADSPTDSPKVSDGWILSQVSDASDSSEDETSRKGWDAIDFAIRWNPFVDGQNVVSNFINKYMGNDGEESRKNRRAYKLVKSLPFAALSYIAITLNSLFIGLSMQLQMDAAVNGRGTEMEEWSDSVELVFVVFFTLELSCKLLAEDVYVYLGSDWQWNALDTILVLAGFVQMVMDELSDANSPNLTFSRAIRLFRITRVLRIVRMVRVCQSLRVMIFSIFKSLDALFWVLAVLLFFKYIFAMIFMHGTISFVDSYFRGDTGALTPEEMNMWPTPQDHYDYIKTSWGSIDRAIITLFESITGGRDWGEVYYSLVKIGVGYGLLFLVYIYFMVFLVLNVVIGTVVDVTSGVAGRDRDRMVEDEIKALKDYAHDIKAFFQQADADGSGQLSWEEFRTHLEDNRVKAYFQTLNLDIRQAHILFRLLDCNDNGEVGIDEFLDGCLRLRGQAKNLDLHLVIFQLEKLINGTSMISGGARDPNRKTTAKSPMYSTSTNGKSS
ncbi:unnamed protein product [Prorocentrum cordatum]|uniref:EF-hand domain-containing protein n=1 Tax=Prorocentrum cordatum TaxID=2364126 RepID=A0ABN9VSA8_9DINO|nr:unnamed protein product [Polarella glacialis]